MKLISVVVLLLVVAAAVRAGHQHPATPPPASPAARTAPTTATTATHSAGRAGQWVVTDSYYDPQFARRTVICVDANGDLRTATGWQEVDVPGARINAPCPAGRVLDEGVFGPLTTGGDH